MKLTVKPQIVDNRYSVIVKFKEFGSTQLTAEMEQKLIDDYSPSFKLSDLVFEGKYYLDTSTKKVVINETDGDEVRLSLPNKEIKINEVLEVGCTVHKKEISDSEIGTSLKDADLVAQAKIQLFIDVIKKKIDETLLALGDKLNEFEEEYEIEVG